MTLTAGTLVGPYEIVGALGSGGMGEVYRARDTKLGREVALKVLPEEFAADAERMARFEREAKVLASLNHPNIAAIHGFEESGDLRALVMELVEGQTLADLITRGPIPLDEALPIARQIAEGLEYAHERGIVHRDLKPANVKITPDGVVKILDFGLAKALEGDAVAKDPSSSPTMSRLATQAGIILGTAAYMAPEQAKGKVVDRRADIWAFGCVLYEMLTGKRPFDGDTVTDILAAVVKDEPDWTALPASTQPSILRLLRRCLTKDARERLQAIGEGRIAIQRIEKNETEPEGSGAARRAPVPAPLWRRILPWAAGFTLALALGMTAGYFLRKSPVSQDLHLAITLPPGFHLDTNNASMEFSPEGQRLVLAGAAPGGLQQLWIRSLIGDQLQPLAGTTGATYPFWSPDARYLGFFAEQKLKKIEIATGIVQTLCDAPNGRGATWNQFGQIVYSPDYQSGLYEVPASGGTPTQMTHVAAEIMSHRLPHFLPDGRRLLFFSQGKSNNNPDAGIYCLDLASRQAERVAHEVGEGRFVPPDHLIFFRGRNLMAQGFDAKDCRVTGQPVLIAENVSFNPDRNTGEFAVSESGMLAYQRAGVAAKSQLTLFDADGNRLGVVGQPESFGDEVMLSPDDRKVATTITDSEGLTSLWVYDLASGVGKRLTIGSTYAGAGGPAWSPDGKQLAFDVVVSQEDTLFVQASDGSSSPRSLFKDNTAKQPNSWSPDGKSLAFDAQLNKGVSLWLLPLEGNQKPRQIVSVAGWALQGAFSPDGNWLAYSSNETGRYEIYVVSFPGPGGKFQVSSGGGMYPEWLKGGSELAFVDAAGKLQVVDVHTTGRQFETGPPRTIFGGSALPVRPGKPVGEEGATPVYITRDGKRILLAVPTDLNSETPLALETNWLAGMKRK
jgi:serine/threonine protein kinase/Tol biopolymer transport system component